MQQDYSHHDTKGAMKSYFKVSERSLEVLEWSSVQHLLAEKTRTPQGKTAALGIVPGAWSRGECADRSQAAFDLFEMNAQGITALPISDVPDLGNLLKRIQRSGSMSLEEFVNLIKCQRAAISLDQYLGRFAIKKPALQRVLAGIETLETWCRKHFSLIDPQGQLVDGASQDLRALRVLTKDLHEKIKRKLEDFLHNPKLAEIMQDFYVTIRDGRYVVPIKINFRGRVPGIVHDVSNTEQTLFIEPQEIVEWNNQLKVAEKEIEREIERILAQVVEATKPALGALEKNLAILVRADLVSAASKLIDSWKGKACAATWRQQKFEVHELFHPLLALSLPPGGDREVVSNSFSFSQGLILTGPNTGGKTVLLKSLGLACMLAHCGLPIPARSCELPENCGGLRADIGDDQSIKDNLSTFSGHLAALKAMIEDSQRGDLVLIDEIATGTSPEEGQPLAQAVIEEILSRQIHLFVTTHYGGLKQFAMIDDRCRIAAMAFDSISRRPTFKMELDIPGESSAFDIAEQMGLPESVIKRARSLKGEVSIDLGRAISKLEEARRGFFEKQKDLELSESKAKEREAKAQEKILELEAKMRESVAAEARESLKKFSALRDELAAAIKNATGPAGLTPEANQLFTKISDAQDQVRQAIEGVGSFDPRARAVTEQDLKADTVVEVEGFGLGTIVEPPRDLRGPKTQVSVQVGDLRVSVTAGRLMIPPADRANSYKASRSAMTAARERRVTEKLTPRPASSGSSVCDIRGKTVEEGLRRVEATLNDLAFNDSGVVTIIHGHGTDRLKDAIRTYISKERPELTFRSGTWPGEGGDGVTVVERAKI